MLLGNKDLLSMTLPHEEIKELHKRWYQLCDNALEIFLTNGKTSLLAFTSTRVFVYLLYNSLTSLKLYAIILIHTHNKWVLFMCIVHLSVKCIVPVCFAGKRSNLQIARFTWIAKCDSWRKFGSNPEPVVGRKTDKLWILDTTEQNSWPIIQWLDAVPCVPICTVMLQWRLS